MKKINISISPLPPFVSFQFDLPIEKISKSLLMKKTDPILGGQLLNWCLQTILDDQFTEGDAGGAWGRRYQDYMHFLYGEDNLPEYKSYKESITCSAIITHALCNFRKVLPQIAVTQGLLPRLKLLFDYLKRHQDPVTGGFGLARSKYRGPAGIAVDLRHTIWAVLSLWDLQEIDSNSVEMIRQAAPYIVSSIFSLNSEQDITLSYAVTQRLLAMPRGNEILQLPANKYRSLQKNIESIVYAKYDKYQGSWDMDKDPAIATVDNAMDVLSMVVIHDNLDPDLGSVMKDSAHKIYRNFAINVSETKTALPFHPNGKPDIATTLQFLYIVYSNLKFYDFSSNVIHNLVNFITDPNSREPYYNSNSYSWNLASALHLV